MQEFWGTGHPLSPGEPRTARRGPLTCDEGRLRGRLLQEDHVLQQGAPAVAAVVEVVVGLPMVVVGASLAAAPAFLPGRRHLEEHVPTAGRGPQDQAGRECGGGEAARREAG